MVDFAVPTDHKVKLKEKEKRNNFLDLAREQEKLWNIRVTLTQIMIGAFGTVNKG